MNRQEVGIVIKDYDYEMKGVGMEIRVTKSTAIGQKPRPKDSELGFGKYTTDHMFLMDYREGKGWHDARIEPYHDLSLDPWFCTTIRRFSRALRPITWRTAE
jgi:hypothetical protein